MAKVRKKSRFLGKFLAALLGFFIGTVAALGGLFGAGYYIIAYVPIKDGLDIVGDATGAADKYYTDYITEEFASNSIFGAVKEIQAFAEEAAEGTASLSSLEKFSPLVRDKLSDVCDLVQKYGVPLYIDELMEKPFSELPTYLGNAINKTEIGKAATEYSSSGESSGLIDLISYGEENYEYIIVEGKKEMLGNNKPTTLDAFKSNDSLVSILKNISLLAFLQSTGSTHDTDLLLRTFLYGEENVDYVMVGSTVERLPRYYVYDVGTDSFTDSESKLVYTKSGDAWFNAKTDYDILSCTEGEYVYKVIDENEETVCMLKKYPGTNPALANAYEVYRISEGGTAVQQMRRGLTVGDLMEDGIDFKTFLNKINLGDLLELDANSDPVLLSIAYGAEGTDYTVDGTKIVPVTTPTKVGDLMDTDTLKEKVYDLTLASLLDISPLDLYDDDTTNDPDSMLLLLAFGEENTHYELVDTTGDGKPDKIQWLNDASNNPYSERTIRDLTAEDSNVFDSITIASVLNVTTGSDPLLIALAYGSESRYEIVGDKFVMNQIVSSVVGGVAYDDMNNPADVTTFQETVGSENIYYVEYYYDVAQTMLQEKYYLRGNGNEYYAYDTLEEARAGDADTRLKYSKQMLSTLRNVDKADVFLKNVPLGAALDIAPTSSDKLMVAIAYGYEGEEFDIVGGEVVWNINTDTGLPYRPRTLNDLGNAKTIIDKLHIGDFSETVVNKADNPLMYTIQQEKWTVGDLTLSNINGLKLSDVLVISDTDDGSILYALRDTKIGNLETSIEDLTVEDILGDDAKSNRFLKQIATTPIKDLKTTMDTLSVANVFADEVYVTPNVSTSGLKGEWKYMLTDPNGVKAPEAYTFNDFNAMLSNLRANMKTATLLELKADGVLDFEDSIKLDSGVLIYVNGVNDVTVQKILYEEYGDATGSAYYDKDGNPKDTLGDITLIDLINIIDRLSTSGMS